MRRVRARLAGVLCLVVFAVVAPPVTPAALADTVLSPTRIVGGAGHAGLYAWGMATLPDGSILVGDYWNFRITRFSGSGQPMPDVVTRSTQGSGIGKHQSPYGIAVDPVTWDVYFGDVDGGKSVDRYDYDPATGTWNFRLQWGSNGAGVGKYKYPSYVAMSSDRRVFVSDQWDHNVVVNDRLGNELFQFGTNGAGPGQFKQPRGLAFCHHCDSPTSDLLFITDNYNGRVQVWRVQDDGTTASSVTYLWSFGTKGSAPGQFGVNSDLRGIAVEASSRSVWVVDAGSGWVNRYQVSADFTSAAYAGVRAGGYATGPGQLVGGGRGLTLDAEGDPWVGDMPGFRAVRYERETGAFVSAVPTPHVPPPPGLFNQPRGVALDGSGNLFVTDTHSWRVMKLAPDGTQLAEWGHRGGGPYGFNYQRGIAVDPRNGDVVVADTDNHMIKKYDNDGTFLWSVGGFGTSVSPVKLKNPHGVDVGPDGMIYVADTQNQRVVVLDPNGAGVLAFGTKGSAAGQFQFNRNLTLDDNGTSTVTSDDTLWVSDSILGTVQHFTLSGAYLGKIGSLGSANDQLKRVADIETNAICVFVADVDTHKIKVFLKDGTFVYATAGGGSTLGRMFNPHGLDLTPDGRLFVAEQTGERIHEFAIVDGSSCDTGGG